MRAHLAAPLTLIAALYASMAAAQPSPRDLPLEAQSASAPPPITISYVDGRVDVVRPDGVVAAEAPDILDDDDRLVTAEGRTELLFDDGTVVHVDRQSDLRVDRGVRLRLVSGRLAVHTPATVDAVVIATPAGVVRLAPRGAYDLRADDLRGDTTVAVLQGTAVLGGGERELRVDAGDALSIDPRELRPSRARTVGPDAFLDWSRRRLDATTTDRDMALPAPIQPWAADLALHGQWSTLPQHGAVWFPSAGPSWRPYYYGSWRFTRHGWTWIDADRWAWPVHHYGRWGRHASLGWYWIPQRTWGPAWVGWAVASQHVAWAPLGWNRRPIVDFNVGARGGPAGLFASSWSILPRHAFGRRGPIYRDLEDPRQLSGPVLGGFVSQMIGPRGPGDSSDRYLVGGRRPPYNPPPSSRGGSAAPPIAYQPSRGPATRGESPSAPGSTRRRPTDAAPVDPAPPITLPRERSWSTAPSAMPVDETRSRSPRQRGYGYPPAATTPRGEAPPPSEAQPPATAARPSGPPPSEGSARTRPRGWSAPSAAPVPDGAAAATPEARPRSGGERRAPRTDGDSGGAAQSGGADHRTPRGNGDGARGNGSGGRGSRGQARPRG